MICCRNISSVAPSEPVARYWACVEWFDRTCGELLDHLDKRGQRTNTIVLYTTDNGWIQNPAKTNQFAPRSKLTPYEGGVRTPIMISWPGQLKPRRDKEHLASNVDLWPTLAALLQDAAAERLAGHQPHRRRARSRSASAIFGEQYAHNIADVDAPTRSLEHRWVIDGWWKLIVPECRRRHQRHAPSSTISRTDPWEKTDLAGKERRRVARICASSSTPGGRRPPDLPAPQSGQARATRAQPGRRVPSPKQPPRP